MVRKTQSVSSPTTQVDSVPLENVVIMEQNLDVVKPQKRAKKTKSQVLDVLTSTHVDVVGDSEQVEQTEQVEQVEQVEQTEQVEQSEQTATTSTSSYQFIEISNLLQQLISAATQLKTLIKNTDKQVAKELKMASKSTKHKKKTTGTRAPSGFAKPTLISDELAVFLGKDLNTLMSRTEVSKEINVYIKNNSLKDETNGKIIHPDEKLEKLLNVGKEIELTYFNLQHYLKHHFPRPVVV
jgi:chromatin remodeling complex protein RSC6